MFLLFCVIYTTYERGIFKTFPDFNYVVSTKQKEL